MNDKADDKKRDFVCGWMAAELPVVLVDIRHFSEVSRGGSSGPKYTKPEAWGLLCHWLKQCAELNLPPPVELAEAMHLLAGRPALPVGELCKARVCLPEHVSSWNKAVLYEAHLAADPAGEKPSKASVNALSELTGRNRDTIRRWRKQQVYRDMVKAARQQLQEKQE
jgi:hypothetical protein